MFEAVETRANELAIVSLDGRPTHLLGPWQTASSGRFRPLSMSSASTPPRNPKVDPRHLTLIDRARNPYVTEAIVENTGPACSMSKGGWSRRLASGRYTFWNVNRKVEVKRVDLRPQPVEITAQEMLTKDRIALRVTLTAFRRIVDPERAAQGGGGCGRLALPAGPVRDPRSGCRADARRGAFGEELAGCAASGIRDRSPRQDRHRGHGTRREGRYPSG